MIGHLLDWLAAAIVSIISWSGYLGIVALMAAESACLPLPSEIIMPFAGYLASTGRFGLFWVATAGALGCNLGSTLAYFVAARGGRALVDRWGRYLLLEPDAIAWSERFFARYGSATVFVSRLLPIVRTFIAVPAGLARMSQWRFQLYTFVGSWPWCYGLATVGFKLGRAWDRDPTLKTILHRFDVVIVVLLVAALAGFVWLRLRHRRANA